MMTMTCWFRCTAPLRSLAAITLAAAISCDSAAADAKEVSIARQFGDSYLPLMVMERRMLVEKHARKKGLGEVKVNWTQVSGGAAANDALLSGRLDFVSGGVGPMLTIWSATRGKVKGVAALNTMPLLLNTNNEKVRTLRDFTAEDRIAVPAVRVSMQAVLLRMAAAREFGESQFDKLDPLTVTMKQADATAALLSRSAGVSAHFGNSPFQFAQLQDPGIKTVVSSFDILGGPATFGVVWATAKFRDENPKLYQAVFDALGEAMEIINADKPAAAKLYVEMAGPGNRPEFVQDILQNPQVSFSRTPLKTFSLARFMYKVGQIKLEPKAWKDYFFPEAHAFDGS